MAGLTPLADAGAHIAALVESLGDERAERLADLLGSDTAVRSGRLLSERLGIAQFTATGVRTHLTAALRATDAATVATMVVACVAERRRAGPPPRTEFVMTGHSGGRFRTTFSTALQCISGAQESVILAGYAITAGADELLHALADVARRNVRVTIVGERLRSVVPIIAAAWTAGLRPPDLYSYEGDPDDHMTKFHAKILVVDRRLLLTTSGNFTLHGLFRNVEMGVLNEGNVARDAQAAFMVLVGQGVLQSIPWPKTRW